jgi:hypothetical protein
MAYVFRKRYLFKKGIFTNLSFIFRSAKSTEMSESVNAAFEVKLHAASFFLAMQPWWWHLRAVNKVLAFVIFIVWYAI